MSLWIIPLIRAIILGIFQIENSETKVIKLTEFSISKKNLNLEI